MPQMLIVGATSEIARACAFRFAQEGWELCLAGRRLDALLVMAQELRTKTGRPVDCVEYDAARNNIYINDGSIRPTTRLTTDGLPEDEPADGNVVDLVIEYHKITITAISTKTGQGIGKYSFVSQIAKMSPSR